MLDQTDAGSSWATWGRSVRRGALALMLLALLGGSAGAVFGVRSAQEHSAQATVLVAPLEGNPYSPEGRGDELVNLATEAEIVSSDTVGQLVADTTGAALGEVLAGLTVSVPPNTQILTIGYTATEKETAVVRAQAFADEFLRFRQSRAMDLVDSRERRYEQQISGHEEELAARVRELTSANSVGARALAREQIDGLTVQIGQLRSQLAQLQATPADPGQVVSPATIRRPGLLSTPLAFGALGALAAVALGLAFLLARMRSENRVHHVDDLVAAGVPVLGTVASDDHRWASALVRIGDSQDTSPAMSQALQSARVALLTEETRRPVSILMVSAARQMGAPASALAVALAAAMSHFDVILVDASDSPEGMAPLVEGQGDKGLRQVLEGEIQVESALTQLHDHLRYLPAGTGEEDLDNLVMSPEMGVLVQQLTAQAALVIVAAGAAQDARARALTSVTDSLVVEVAAGAVQLEELTAVLHPATGPASELLGVLFVERTPRRRFHRRGE